MDESLWPVVAGLGTLIVSLVGVVWVMLQKQISLRHSHLSARINELRTRMEDKTDHRFERLEEEMGRMRDRVHDMVNRFAAVETVVKYKVLKNEEID